MGEPKPQDRRRHFRGKARAGRRVRVRYRAAGATTWLRAETRNIGVGGAFILGAELSPGTDIELELELPMRAAPMPLAAQVRWRSDGKGADPAGIGVQFTDVDIDILLELNGYLASLTGTEPDAE